jgi:hypothetical protein
MAAGMMAMQIRVAGFQVEHRPFGVMTSLPAPDDPFWNQRPGWQEWLSKTVSALASGLLGRKPARQHPPDSAGDTMDAE